MPGHQGIGGDPIAFGQNGVQLLLLPGERLASQRIQFVEDAVELCDVLLACDDGHGVVVVEAEFLCRSVAELHQTKEVLDDGVADLPAGAPGGLSLRRVCLRRQERVDVTHGDIPPVDAAAIAVVGLLDLCIQRHDLCQQIGLDLVLEVGVVELVELTSQTRIVGRPGFLERLDAGEVLPAAVNLPNLKLQSLVCLPRLWIACCGGVPVRQIGLRPKRGDRGCVRLDKTRRPALPVARRTAEPEHAHEQQSTPNEYRSHAGPPNTISRTASVYHATA